MTPLLTLILLFYGLAAGISLILIVFQRPDRHYSGTEWIWVSLLFPIVGPVGMLAFGSVTSPYMDHRHYNQKKESWISYKAQFVEHLRSMLAAINNDKIIASQSDGDIGSVLKEMERAKPYYLDLSLHYLFCDQVVNLIEEKILANKMLCKGLSKQDKKEITMVYCYCIGEHVHIDFERGTIEFL
jgi:hypothetical protein